MAISHQRGAEAPKPYQHRTLQDSARGIADKDEGKTSLLVGDYLESPHWPANASKHIRGGSGSSNARPEPALERTMGEVYSSQPLGLVA